MGNKKTFEKIIQAYEFIQQNQGKTIGVQEMSLKTGISWDACKRYAELFEKMNLVKIQEKCKLIAFTIFKKGDKK